MMPSKGTRSAGAGLAAVGVAGVLLLHWMVFFWVRTEATQGVVQRIFYIHVPSAWVAFFAFGIAALCSAVYLWLRDDRVDLAAVAAAEGGFVFTTVVLVTGPLWARVAWGVFWEWEPRLTLTLLLWFIYLGYFLVRSSTEGSDAGKRYASVVAIMGALLIPLIHVSVLWFRSLHPRPVVLKPEGPTLESDMLWTLLTGFASLTVLFLGLFVLRYSIGLAERTARARRLPPSSREVP